MPKLIEDFEQRYILGVTAMDETHREFVELVNRLGEADKKAFIPLFEELFQHTQAHFAAESRLMEESRFPARREHEDDHQRVLGDINRFAARTTAGSTLMARAYLTQQLPDWFNLHALTMDSALAAHLKQSSATLRP
jgi:hemerythrin